MIKKIIIIFSILFFLLLGGYALFQISKSRTFQFFGGLINRGETKEKVVALTFDDAPSEYTDEFLKILAEKNVKATFYVIGQNLEKYPDFAKAIIENGHELGNHSYSHRRLILKSQKFIKNEIEKTNQLIRTFGHAGEITFRPPNGKKLFGLPWYSRQNNIRTIMWDVEPDTNFSGDVEKIVNYTLANTKPGSIILMHPFCGETCTADREALSEIIDGLKTRGYNFVTVSELLKY